MEKRVQKEIDLDYRICRFERMGANILFSDKYHLGGAFFVQARLFPILACLSFINSPKKWPLHTCFLSPHYVLFMGLS